MEKTTLKNFMQNNNLTQKEVAEKTGLSSSLISYVYNKQRFTKKTFERFKNVYNIELIGYFMDEVCYYDDDIEDVKVNVANENQSIDEQIKELLKKKNDNENKLKLAIEYNNFKERFNKTTADVLKIFQNQEAYKLALKLCDLLEDTSKKRTKAKTNSGPVSKEQKQDEAKSAKEPLENGENVVAKKEVLDAELEEENNVLEKNENGENVINTPKAEDKKEETINNDGNNIIEDVIDNIVLSDEDEIKLNEKSFEDFVATDNDENLKERVDEVESSEEPEFDFDDFEITNADLNNLDF